MDTMYRRKEETASGTAMPAADTNTKKKAPVSAGYVSRIKPRDAHPDESDASVSRRNNLMKLNTELTGIPPEPAVSHKTEDTGARIITKKSAIKTPVPLAIIFCSIIITAVFMYMLSLFVEIEEYNTVIAELQSEINTLKDTSNRLEVQLEAKYDLDEIERIATEKYGMVSKDTLPKRYITVTENNDLCENVESVGEGDNGLSKLINGFATAVRDWME